MANGTAITEEMRKSIGSKIFPDFPPEEVSMWAIRRYLEAVTDDNPLWIDEEYARGSRWGGIIAPPLFLEAFNPANHAFRKHKDMSHMSLPFELPFTRTFMASNEFQFFKPVKPGDLIASTCKIGDIYERQSSSGAGRMIFVRMDNEHRNQENELVGITSEAMVSIEGSSKKSGSEGAPPLSEQADQPHVTGGQVFFEDVEAGTPLPSLVKEVSLFSILKWGAAVNDYGPHHFDYPFATQVLGLPNVIAHGPFNTAIMAQLVTGWIGGWGVLVKHYVEMRGNVFPGDTITYQARVSKKYIHESEGFVECESRAENQNGRRVAIGKSTAVLPQKKRA